MDESTESDKYKQRGGCVEGNYLPEPLALGQHKDIHLFSAKPNTWTTLWGEGGEERERVREREGMKEEKRGREFEPVRWKRTS